MDTVFEKHSKVSFDNILHSDLRLYLFDNFNVSINASLRKWSPSINVLSIQFSALLPEWKHLFWGKKSKGFSI